MHFLTSTFEDEQTQFNSFLIKNPRQTAVKDDLKILEWLFPSLLRDILVRPRRRVARARARWFDDSDDDDEQRWRFFLSKFS
jgi:hypothetical protein